MRRSKPEHSPSGWDWSCFENAPLNMDVDSPENPRNPHDDTQNLPQEMAVLKKKVYALERALREEPFRELTNHPYSSKFLQTCPQP
eukprot:617771-Pelagomonas_calceolata.AAC.1